MRAKENEWPQLDAAPAAWRALRDAARGGGLLGNGSHDVEIHAADQFRVLSGQCIEGAVGQQDGVAGALWFVRVLRKRWHVQARSRSGLGRGPAVARA
jgi:hypothetical protein